MAEAQEKKKGSSKKGLILAFIIILLAINAVQVWMNISKSKEINQKEQTITNQKAKIDSVQHELDVAIRDLEDKKSQIASLGGDTTRLGEHIRQLMVERDNLAHQSKDSYNKYLTIKERIQDANHLKEQAEAEVRKLKYQLAQQDTTIHELKKTITVTQDTINSLKLTQQQLSEKLAIASVLTADHFNIDAVNQKGKEKSGGEYKAKSVDKIRIIFKLGENKVATREGKEVYLRVIEPDGSALFDTGTGGGLFKTDEGKEIPYTLKQEVLYMGDAMPVRFEYKKGAPYKVGNHRIEVYVEGHKIGEGTFTLK